MIHYIVSFPDPHTHYVRVQVVVPLSPGQTELELVLSVWAPGSYEIHDFAGRVHDVRAHAASRATSSDEAQPPPTAKPLAVTKIAKNRWRVVTRPDTPAVVFAYLVFAHEIDVDYSYLDADRCTINGPGVFVYVEGHQSRPCRLTLHPPSAWATLETGLTPDPHRPAAFTAADFDELIDAPIFLGNDHIETFSVAGVPHRMVFTGPGHYDAPRIAADTARVVEAAIAVFDDVPYSRYVFFMDIVADGGGGLEHRNSTHMIFPRFRWRTRRDYLSAMGLISHEFFHTWNVKRLRPRELGPFDYNREVHTDLLWFAEGFTSYYDNLLLRRAAILSAREYLNELAREFRRLDTTPGRHHQSLAESSFDTWIKFYRRHSDSPNTTISYYNKGAILAWVLDMEIRRLTKTQRSLDDVMRLLYQRHYRQADTGLTAADIQAAASEVAGQSLAQLITSLTHDRSSPDYAPYLDMCGLALRPISTEAPQSDGDESSQADPSRTPKTAKAPKATKTASRGRASPSAKSDADPKTPPPYLGIRTRLEDTNRLVVAQVFADSPAQRAGLSPRDEIIAFGDYRVSSDSLDKRLAEAKVGDQVPLLISRSGLVRTLTVTLGARPPIDQAIQPLERATPQQRRQYQHWLNSDWPALTPSKTGPELRPAERLV